MGTKIIRKLFLPLLRIAVRGGISQVLVQNKHDMELMENLGIVEKSEINIIRGSGIDINVILGTFTTPFNMIGVPTISIPCGFSESNMPIGMQIAGNRFEERLVLNAAYAYENNTLHHLKTPDITAMNS